MAELDGVARHYPRSAVDFILWMVRVGWIRRPAFSLLGPGLIPVHVQDALGKEGIPEPEVPLSVAPSVGMCTAILPSSALGRKGTA